MNKEELEQAMTEAFKLGQRFGCSYGMGDFPNPTSRKKWTDLQDKWQSHLALGVTLKFHRVSEKVPKPDQTIIWLQRAESFGFYGFEPQQINAEYMLTELDEENEETGCYVCWNKEDKGRQLGDRFEVNGIKYRVDMQFDGWRAGPDDLWVDVEEYWNYFEK